VPRVVRLRRRRQSHSQCWRPISEGARIHNVRGSNFYEITNMLLVNRLDFLPTSVIGTAMGFDRRCSQRGEGWNSHAGFAFTTRLLRDSTQTADAYAVSVTQRMLTSNRLLAFSADCAQLAEYRTTKGATPLDNIAQFQTLVSWEDRQLPGAAEDVIKWARSVMRSSTCKDCTREHTRN
jgi:hypothetical protein